uniref:Uncharacterized protein n=1 Tax=viral metagenome TaxID=1070528 RepID=A0A6M3J254_9ZZZZ
MGEDVGNIVGTEKVAPSPAEEVKADVLPSAEEIKTYTQAEVDKLLSGRDQRVTTLQVQLKEKEKTQEEIKAIRDELADTQYNTGLLLQLLQSLKAGEGLEFDDAKTKELLKESERRKTERESQRTQDSMVAIANKSKAIIDEMIAEAGLPPEVRTNLRYNESKRLFERGAFVDAIAEARSATRELSQEYKDKVAAKGKQTEAIHLAARAPSGSPTAASKSFESARDAFIKDPSNPKIAEEYYKLRKERGI